MDFSTIAVTLKAAAGIAQDAGKIPLYSAILDLQATMLELSAKQADLLGENSVLRARISEMEKHLRLREEFEFSRNAYWKRDADHTDGPFCMTCFDSDGKAIRLIHLANDHGKCGVCKNVVSWTEPIDATTAPQRRVAGPGWVHAWRQ